MRELFKEVNLSDEFMENFTGFMLGDGYLSNRNKSKHSAQFCMRNKFPNYVYDVSRLLSEEDVEHVVKVNDIKGSFKGSGYSSTLYTKFYKTFTDLEGRWYETRSDGTHFKVVPQDLKLTPISLLQWYIGDGYLVNLYGKPQRVQFCTDRYTDEEIYFLRDCFDRDFNINAQIDWNRRRLRIPKRYLADFFEIIPKCPNAYKNDLGYKWA